MILEALKLDFTLTTGYLNLAVNYLAKIVVYRGYNVIHPATTRGL